MFSFLKPKVSLRDIIPNDYIDIHSHLLPGIDDGAKSESETIFLVEALQEMGFSKFITTPHIYSGVWDNSKKGIKELELTSKPLFGETNMKAASEYLMNDHFVTLLKNNEILTLKENYVLVEMSYINPPIQLFDIIFDIQVAGYQPILAHPERYFFYHNSFDEYLKLKKAGCSFQLNLLSTVGYYGMPVAKIANELLKKGMIDFVGSDVHHKNHIVAFSNPIIIKEIDSLKESISYNRFFNF